MNYLAHWRVSQSMIAVNPEICLGNLLGDFVKGPLTAYRDRYSSAFITGLQLHRQIDTYTDTHPIYRQSKRRCDRRYRHLSSIVIDIAYDHLLSVHWQRFSAIPLPEAIAQAYDTLNQWQDLIPQEIQPVLPYLIRQDWLGTNQTIAGVSCTFGRVSRRLKRPSPLADAAEELAAHYSELEADFLAFFPDLLNAITPDMELGKLAFSKTV